MRQMRDLVRELVAIDSVNPTLVEGGAGEAEIAAFIAGWMRDAGLKVSATDVAPGRPNVVGRVRGSRGHRTLLLLCHTDTVTTAGMDRALEPAVDSDRLRGRGAYDMKGGLAAALTAASALQGRLDGDLVVAAVCDEEAGGIGTRALLATGERFDAAIVPEPTDEAIGIAHHGYAGFEIETTGVAAHGSRPDLGVDAIVTMGPVLVELGRLAEGRPIHASVIAGGEEASSYPARCVLEGEWRTTAGDEPERELLAVIDRSGAHAQLRMTHTGRPFEVATGSEIVETLSRLSGGEHQTLPYWTDAALLAEAGIPAVLFGPRGDEAHGADEWVDLTSVSRVRDVLIDVALDFLGPASG